MIKAIPTRYAGRLFRSRLEARWAMFFTAMRYSWEYEVEGFSIDGVHYLPDFVVRHPRMPHIVRYVEIKPQHVKQNAKFDAFEKQVRSASIADGAKVAGEFDEVKLHTREAVLLSGSPRIVVGGSFAPLPCPRCGWVLCTWIDAFLAACTLCDIDTPCGGGHPPEAGALAESTPHKGLLVLDAKAFNDISRWGDYISRAADAADAARFGT